MPVWDTSVQTLFPGCTFRVLLPHGYVLAGRRLGGVLELDVPKRIPRAEAVELLWRTTARAGYGMGRSRTVVERTMFAAPLHIALPEGMPLERGLHRYPFAIDVPSWLPPAFSGDDCAIEHAIETRLDVDWGRDPTAKETPIVLSLPGQGVRSPATVRSPGWFHESLVLEVSLASAVVAQDEPLLGTIALRSGHAAPLEAVELTREGRARIAMGSDDERRAAHVGVRIPADALREGRAVPFQVPPSPWIPPTFRTGFIDHDVFLRVTADIPWARDPSFDVQLYVLPSGSTIHGVGGVVPVGVQRLEQISGAMAAATGLRPGAGHPVLVEGAVGPVAIRVADGPRERRLGVDIHLVFPDVELGIDFRPLGALRLFRESPLVPEALRGRYALSVRPAAGAAAFEERILASFVHAVLDKADGAEEVRFSDHQLGLHVDLTSDEPSVMVDVARFAHQKARFIADAIARLPFPAPLASSRAAWEAVATEEGGFLVPTGPALYGLSFHAHVLGGDERAITATIRTVHRGGAAFTVADVDCRQAPLTGDGVRALEHGAAAETLRDVRECFSAIRPLGVDRVTLERPGFTEDPRRVLPAIEAFLSWVLECRGERRQLGAYR